MRLATKVKLVKALVAPIVLFGVDSPRHKHWPAGPMHFSDRRASTFCLSLARTGHLDMSGHQISNSAGPNDDKSQYSSTCHEGTLPVRSQSVPSWQG